MAKNARKKAGKKRGATGKATKKHSTVTIELRDEPGIYAVAVRKGKKPKVQLF